MQANQTLENRAINLDNSGLPTTSTFAMGANQTYKRRVWGKFRVGWQGRVRGLGQIRSWGWSGPGVGPGHWLRLAGHTLGPNRENLLTLAFKPLLYYRRGPGWPKLHFTLYSYFPNCQMSC